MSKLSMSIGLGVLIVIGLLIADGSGASIAWWAYLVGLFGPFFAAFVAAFIDVRASNRRRRREMEAEIRGIRGFQ
jgi:membrane associated rhomboid family serine protease